MSAQTAEEAAFECLYGMHRAQFSRDVFNAILNDRGEMGETLRKFHRAIAATIKKDRAAQEAVYAARALTRPTSP